MLSSTKDLSKVATAQHIKAIIKSHYEDEGDRFTTLVLQMAAHEAKLGHTNLADEIRKLVDRSKTKVRKLKPFNQDLDGLVLEIEKQDKLTDLITSKPLKERINRILQEFKQRDKLQKHGLENRRKVLLTGPPGTGKTMTASIIAKELHLPLYVILMDKMVTKFMGETSSKLRMVFDTINHRRGVYLFDEFDAIGGERGKENDVGEMRRVLNSFLQFIERDESDSIIVAATNNLKLLDQALFRRFDDVLQYHLPTKEEIIQLFDNRLTGFKGNFDLDDVIIYASGLSHAEISQACLDAIKESILNDKKKVTKSLLTKVIQDRGSAYEN